MSKGGRDAVLDAQMAECRELLGDVRAATRDLRSAVKEAKEAYPALADELVQTTVKAELAKFQEGMAAAIISTQKAIFDKFNKLTNLLMTGSENGRPRHGKIDLEAAIRERTQEGWYPRG